MLVDVVDPRALRSVREHCTLAAKGRKVQSYNEMRFGPRKFGEGKKERGEPPRWAMISVNALDLFFTNSISLNK